MTAPSLDDLRAARHAMRVNSKWREAAPRIGDTAEQVVWDLLAVVDRMLGEDTDATRWADGKAETPTGTTVGSKPGFLAALAAAFDDEQRAGFPEPQGSHGIESNR